MSKDILDIERGMNMNNLHIVQSAWLSADAPQCETAIRLNFSTFALTVYPPEICEPRWLVVCYSIGTVWAFSTMAEALDYAATI